MFGQLELSSYRPAGTRAQLVAMAVIVAGSLFCRNAIAVPSFARQTGMPCAQCHTLSFGPALTEFGREF